MRALCHHGPRALKGFEWRDAVRDRAYRWGRDRRDAVRRLRASLQARRDGMPSTPPFHECGERCFGRGTMPG